MKDVYPKLVITKHLSINTKQTGVVKSTNQAILTKKMDRIQLLDPYSTIFILLRNKTSKFLVKNSFVLHIKYFIT